MDKLVNSSYLLEVLVERIYSEKIEAKNFDLLDAQAFWSHAIVCFADDVERAFAMAVKVTTLLNAAEQAHLVQQVAREHWARFEALDGTEAWPKAFDFTPDAVDLDSLKATLKERIDREAEATRLLYITNGAGQSMVYRQKMEEAKLVLDGVDDPHEVPHIAAEAAVNGLSLVQMAQQVIAAYRAWQDVSAYIEGKRMAGKKAVSNATDANEAYMGADIDWSPPVSA